MIDNIVTLKVGLTAEVSFTPEVMSKAGLISLVVSGEAADKDGCFFPVAVSNVSLQVAGPGTQRGDMDGDGKVTLADALWALRLAIGAATASPGVIRAADVSPPEGDGQLTVADVRGILRMALSN